MQLCSPTPPRRPLVAVVLVCALLVAGCGDLVEVRPLQPLQLDQPERPTTIIDADGGRLAELAGDGLGRPVPLDRVAPAVVDAVIAVEDTRFREHRGLDARALARALVRNVQRGEIVEGGSTITQQLAKNTVTGGDRTIERKLAEAGVAWQLEDELTKDQILERYLNSAYFGGGAYGVEAAAREWFGVPAAELGLPQAALLAGMLRSPARYDPRHHPEAAREGRDLVLRRTTSPTTMPRGSTWRPTPAASRARRSRPSSSPPRWPTASRSTRRSPPRRRCGWTPCGASAGRGPWTVADYGGQSFGTVDLTTATAWSINVVYAKLIDGIGARRVARLARRMGVRSPLRAYRALALGAQEVSGLDMATVQATLATGGIHRPPVAVERILDGDAVVWERPDDAGTRVLDQSVALQVTSALKGVVERGTGVRAHARRPLAGKTGTTQDGADAWFTGYTPDLAAATWIGYHQRRIPMVPPRTPTTVEGGSWPAEAFARFTLGALEDVPADDFTVRVPDVEGHEVGRARDRLTRAGFDVTVQERWSPSLPPGLVLDQEPASGREVAVPVGYRSTLTVSSTTPEAVAVPDVLGLDLGDAAAQLREAGLVPRPTRICPGGTPTCTGAVERSGQVWESDPAVGATAATGDRVLLRAFPTP